MKEKLEALKAQALEELAAVTSLDALKDLRVKYLGKKGPMTEILRGMASCLPKSVRKSARLLTKSRLSWKAKSTKHCRSGEKGAG